MRIVPLALLGLLALVGGALPSATSAFACGGGPCGERLPNVAATPQVAPSVVEEVLPSPPPAPAVVRRHAPPPVTPHLTETALVCVQRRFTAANPAALAEAIRRAQGEYECLRAGTQAAYALALQRIAELAEKVYELEAANSELQAEIIRLQGLMLAVLPPQPEPPPPPPSSWCCWLWVLLAVAVGGLVGFHLRRRQASSPPERQEPFAAPPGP
jgi:hypothetical protein